MIKFVTKSDKGEVLIGLGITEGNVDYFRKGKPMLVKGEELNLPELNIRIFYIKTENDLILKDIIYPPPIDLYITEGNIEQLRNGRPMWIKGEKINLPDIDIMLFYGETEDAIKDLLKEFIGPSTEVKDMR